MYFFHFIPANYEIGRSSPGELKPLHKLLYGREGRVCFAYQYACLCFVLWLFVSLLFCFHFCLTLLEFHIIRRSVIIIQQGFNVLDLAGSGHCVVCSWMRHWWDSLVCRKALTYMYIELKAEN